MKEVIWSERAMESLANIYDYIFENSPQNAEMVFNTLFNLGNSLSDERIDYAKDPFIVNDRFRCIPKWSYKIIYERKDKEVRIIDIFNTYQHPDRLRPYEMKKRDVKYSKKQIVSVKKSHKVQ